jgi:hypothetical protein
MSEIQINKTTHLRDLEKHLCHVSANQKVPLKIHLARQRKHQFFKEPAMAQFFATVARITPYVLVDSHHSWTPEEALEHYGQNLAGISGATSATTITNRADASPPYGPKDFQQSIAGRHGLLKPYGQGVSRVRELAFLAFDDKRPREPAALAGLVYDQDGFVRRVQQWREQLLDINPGHQQELFMSPGAPRPIMEFLHELYQNGVEHGTKAANNEIIPGIRSLSLRLHSPGSMTELKGFAEGLPELEEYLAKWSRFNRGTSFFEVSINDVGLGIIDRFLATRSEFTNDATSTEGRLGLLLRILLTPESTNGSGKYEQAYSSKDISGQERGAGRGLERALDAVRKLNGFVSLRTAEFWLYRSFPNGEPIGDIPMHQIAGGPFVPVAGTCFAAIFPINLQA